MDNEIYQSVPNDAVSETEDTPIMTRNFSPISSLSADILLEIFRMNANMDEDSALKHKESIQHDTYRAMNAIRISSEVSSVWRNIIINAPLLWANLIDIDLLHRAQNRWRELAIERAQTSPLHVKGSISLTDLDESDLWWLEFLQSSWPRIRKLDLAVTSDVDPKSPLTDATLSKYRKGLHFLSRSNPKLQFFRIKLQNQCNPLETGCTLFDNHAPQLRHFEPENMQFAIESLWLSQLRNFHTSKHNNNGETESRSSVDVLYQVLSQMEHLESLSVDEFTSPTNSFIVPQVSVHLPRLKYFRFRSVLDVWSHTRDFSSTWPLLDCIILDPACSVRVSLNNLTLSQNIDTSILSRLAKDYFQVNNAPQLTLSTGRDVFKLTDTVSKHPFDSSLDRPISVEPFFSLWISFFEEESPPWEDMKIYNLFKEIYSSSFPAVVELDLTVSVEHLGCFKDPQFGQFLSSFTSLKKFLTVPRMLQHLCTCKVISHSTLFPLLEVLEIFVPGFIPLVDIVAPFIQLRKEVGVPIQTFSYRCARYVHMVAIVNDLTPLDDISGLKVVWALKDLGRGEYLCGSGTPEVLNFYKRALEIMAVEFAIETGLKQGTANPARGGLEKTAR